MADASSPAFGLGVTAEAQGMSVQTALLPYALLAFGVCLPIFVWVAGHAPNVAWMSVSFAAFAIGWGVLYVAVTWLKTPAAADLRRRARVHLLSGLVWALAIAQLAVFAHYAGPVRESLLLLALGAAMICVVFTTPWLPSLLIVAPVAIAGPLLALFLGGEARRWRASRWRPPR